MFLQLEMTKHKKLNNYLINCDINIYIFQYGRKKSQPKILVCNREFS